MDDIKIIILESMYKHGFIGKRHTPIDNAVKGIPKHLRGLAKDSIRELIKEGFLSYYQTKHGKDVRINPEEIPAIKEMLKIER